MRQAALPYSTKAEYCTYTKSSPYRRAFTSLFPELKMRGEFFEQRRKVEILIEQAAEKADYRTVYRGDNERAPADALKAPEKRERHYRRHREAG